MAGVQSTCNSVCDTVGETCNTEVMAALTSAEMVTIMANKYGITCSPTEGGSQKAPFYRPTDGVCYAKDSPPINCAKVAPVPERRLCYCGEPSAGGAGDPHIRTFAGDHYTLLKRGNFKAWSFTQKWNGTPVEWQLFASYGGVRFTTQAFLLVEVHSGRTMQITAEDCTWRMKMPSMDWQEVKSSEILPWGNQSEVEIKESGNATNFFFKESQVHLNMKSEKGMRKVASLIEHCHPGNHMDFKIKMKLCCKGFCLGLSL